METIASIASKVLLDRLYELASGMSRPNQRIGTIKRVVEACNAIASGEASTLMKTVLGKDYNLSYNPRISPSTVGRYIEARRKQGDQKWIGPKRETIQSDYELKAYVEAREAERIKPVDKKRKTSHREEVNRAVDRIPSIADRALVRRELALLHSAKRENDIMTSILKKVSPLKYDNIRKGNWSARDEDQMISEQSVSGLQERDVLTIRKLLDRIASEDELSKFGLSITKGRVRHKNLGRVLIDKDELLCLAKICGHVSASEV
ncbi:MAG: hypothetical protein RH946_17275 [Rhodospirillales bacterium]